jgi:N6-L-threonylcarbamoyladenine synthase
VILALESSCDETAVALFNPAAGLIGEWIYSQVALHEKHGGVVPDLATREHLRHFAPLLERARDTAGFAEVKQIAVTNGPGLAACLAIGVAAAKSLALALRVPLVGVNHLRAHAWSPFLPLHAQAPTNFVGSLEALLPHLGLIVSGGNTLLFTLDAARRITVLSSTRDDAAGEALDKGAKLLGLGYPGGPWIEKLAATGNPAAFDFPRGIGPRNELDFSFSGLKTSLRYLLEKMSADDVRSKLPDLCASYQQAVVDALVRKTRAALGQGEGRFRSLGLSGGVANNRTLRAALQTTAKHQRIPFLAAEPKHTGDNAGMIAFAAWADAGVSRGLVADLTVEPSAGIADAGVSQT